jgi:two-component system, chemotaxis family, protein-glutamate methylesterase/glutaminase
VPTRDVVVIGGSAGSLEALKQIVREFPADLPAAIFVVIHLSARTKSYLPEILAARSGLSVSQVTDGAAITTGTIYVAPPDHHLLIGNNHIHLSKGPKEGLNRPSINVTFRSAAAAYGNRVIGILLSGMLDDGASGLWEIGRRGGVTIVQDPAEAEFPSMPMNALQDAAVHYRLPVAEIGRLVSGLTGREEVPDIIPENQPVEQVKFSGFTCPECRGPLYESHSGGPVEFRCRVGHVLSLRTLLNEHTSTQERKLYEAVVALEEGADLAEYTAVRSDADEQKQLMKEAQQLRRHAAAIRKLVEERLTPLVD